ncbi:MAG: excinuclease ABC subunit UvrA [Bacteroidales bacterium]|nr:excinuclease ABC subunit UvrA [Bacteroidales bacterium]
MSGNIRIKGARANNLRNIDVEIPRGKLVVVTGVSGSGKSSLVYDTLFAEGQRRFAESLSSYARQFLGRMVKPDVDVIEGIPPAIAIDQKVTVRNPRSTVGTVTEIYDYLRLVFARIGHTFSPVTGKEVVCATATDVLEYLSTLKEGTVYICSDVKWDTRDDRVELMLDLKQQGYTRFLVGGKPVKIEEVMQSGAPDSVRDVLLLIDRVRMPLPDTPDPDLLTRLYSSVETAFDKGDGSLTVVSDTPSRREVFISRFEADGIVFRKPDEYLFSFNSPIGACPECGGLGKIIGVSEDLVVPDKSRSIYDGAIAPWRGEKMSWFRDHLVSVSEKYGIPIFEPYHNLTPAQRKLIWDGVKAPTEEESLIGINEFFRWVDSNKYKIQYKYMLSRYSGRTDCPVCGGSRLRREALWVKVGGRNIHELLSMNVCSLIEFLENLDLPSHEREIAGAAFKEVLSRLHCIEDVGLGYLTLDRTCNTLSGGESQRVHLVTALGSSLVGSMYILDEPSVGLHPRDTHRLIDVLKRLRDLGNTVVVVEHDEDIMKAADVLIDMGPGAGVSGGNIVWQGTVSEAVSTGKSLTLDYLSGARKRLVREKRQWQYSIQVEGAMHHNLKDIDVRIPLGVLTVVSGVSGSGKSSLVGDILYPALQRHLSDTGEAPGTFRRLSGNLDRIKRVEYVDQNPIGKSSRSNAVTYLKVYDDIRKLLSEQQYAKINGFTSSHFSFNQDGGRCPECQGEGFVKIGMQFMADVTMVCEACSGKRFKPEILEVRYKGKNVDDILAMSVSQAIEFFSEAGKDNEIAARIARRLQPLVDVGLSYITLGQNSSTLSGGESQRIELAWFLSMTGEESSGRGEKIMFIFDEPTTGLHFSDVEVLLKAFDSLLAKGHTIVVVEHNPDVIRNADWVIDLGPEAGDGGGRIVYEGPFDSLGDCPESKTGQFLFGNKS